MCPRLANSERQRCSPTRTITYSFLFLCFFFKVEQNTHFWLIFWVFPCRKSHPSEFLCKYSNSQVGKKLKRSCEEKSGVAFSETHSNTWQGEVFLAGAGFAINGQFIDRADNWENRAVGMLAFQGPVADLLSDAPQGGSIDSHDSEREPVGWHLQGPYLNSCVICC